MAAPKGNRFWEARSSHGRKPKFESPEQLWEACVEYFDWVEANPLEEMKLFHHQGNVTEHTAPKMRAMTIGGLCIFLDIGRTTWVDYCAKEDFSTVTRAVDEIIRDQKFSGAAADLLNANIIARDLGLKDEKGISGHVQVSDLTEDQLDAKFESFFNDLEPGAVSEPSESSQD